VEVQDLSIERQCRLLGTRICVLLATRIDLITAKRTMVCDADFWPESSMQDCFSQCRLASLLHAILDVQSKNVHASQSRNTSSVPLESRDNSDKPMGRSPQSSESFALTPT